MDKTSMEDLLENVANTAADIATDRGRFAALKAAQALVDALETPEERILRLSWHYPTLLTAVRIGIDLKLFAQIHQPTEEASTCDELARATDCDRVLLSRLSKHLAAGGIVKESGPDAYSSTPTSELLALPEGAGPVIDCCRGLGKINGSVLEYFHARGWRNPTDKDDSIFQHAFNTRLHYFDWVFQPGNDVEVEGFLGHMKMKTIGPKWYDTMPVDQILGKGCKAEDVLMIDVGGNTGYDVLGFHQAHPDITGRLIVQDLPSAVEGVDVHAIEPVEPMAHDFFTKQPLTAKAYYLKMVLHDWPDAACRDILSNLKQAMRPDYSKILINEVVVPEQGAEWYTTGVDMLMMVTHSAQERRESDWTALIESAGLKIVKIWDCGVAPEKLIEVELA